MVTKNKKTSVQCICDNNKYKIRDSILEALTPLFVLLCNLVYFPPEE